MGKLFFASPEQKAAWLRDTFETRLDVLRKYGNPETLNRVIDCPLHTVAADLIKQQTSYPKDGMDPDIIAHFVNRADMAHTIAKGKRLVLA